MPLPNADGQPLTIVFVMLSTQDVLYTSFKHLRVMTSPEMHGCQVWVKFMVLHPLMWSVFVPIVCLKW